MRGQARTDEVNEVEHLTESNEEADITQPLFPSCVVRLGEKYELNVTDKFSDAETDIIRLIIDNLF